MVIRLSDFRSPPPPREIPDWVKTPTTKKLFNAAIDEFEIIKQKAKTPANLKIKERHIVLRQLALRCGVSPSTITQRRQPDLIALIQSLNSDLDIFFQSATAASYSSGRKLTKQELIRQNREQKLEIDRLTNLRLVEALSSVLDSEILENSRTQVVTINQLKEEVRRLNRVIAEQALLNQRYIDNA
jgi:hypothetical protein